jgi:hypothetical protein
MFFHTIRSITRKFCSECLNNGIFHRLFWQVKDISLCEIHKVLLVDSCHICGTQQPYLNNREVSRLYCNNCGTNLGERVLDKSVPNNKFINEQLLIIDDWVFLLSREAQRAKLLMGSGYDYSLCQSGFS